MGLSEGDFQRYNSQTNIALRSELRQFDSKTNSSGMSIKVPISGIERYWVGKENYALGPGDFLLVNKGQEVRAVVDSEKWVRSICIYLDKRLYQEIFESLITDRVLEPLSCGRQTELIVDRYKLTNDGLSSILKEWQSMQNPSSLSEEDFYVLTEQLAVQQLSLYGMMTKVKAMSRSTQEEVFARLRCARNFMMDNLKLPIGLDDIASASCMSKYHLLRTYKSVYGVTPIQDLIKERINHSLSQFSHNKSISQIAFESGFTDRRSYTRNFKRHMGISPTQFVKERYNK